MNDDTEKSLWQQALYRFQLIDWEESITQLQVDNLQAALPIKLENETTQVWLKRVLVTAKKEQNESINTWVQRLLAVLETQKNINTELSAQKITECINVWVQQFLESANVHFNPFTEIVRKAAANTNLEEYPLPDSQQPLTTEDDCFQFKINKENNLILIKAQALGLAIENFSNTLIGLSDYERPNKVLVVITLSDWGAGEICVEDTKVIRKMLWNPKIGSIND